MSYLMCAEINKKRIVESIDEARENRDFCGSNSQLKGSVEKGLYADLGSSLPVDGVIWNWPIVICKVFR